MRCHILDPVVSISRGTRVKTPGFGTQGSWVQIPAAHLLIRSWASYFTSLWVSAPLTALWDDSMWLYTLNTEHRAWRYIMNAQETVAVLTSVIMVSTPWCWTLWIFTLKGYRAAGMGFRDGKWFAQLHRVSEGKMRTGTEVSGHEGFI